MSSLELFGSRLARDRYLAVLVTTSPARPDPQISVVNAAVVAHPFTGQPVVGFVARTGAKLVNLRTNPRATLVARDGWEWAATRGPVELIGPDDPHPNIDPAHLTTILRKIYLAAGGRHPDLGAYDEVMGKERRCAVPLHAEKIWTNPTGSEHREPNHQETTS